MTQYMKQCGFKQRFSKKASLECKSKWANVQEISYTQTNMAIFVTFFVLYINLENEKQR